MKRKTKKKTKRKGRYDPRNKLNNLTGSKWLSLSPSVWHSSSKIYPLFSKKDIKNLINLFSKNETSVFIKNINSSLLPKRTKRKYVYSLEECESVDYSLINYTFLPNENINSKIFVSGLENIVDLVRRLKKKLKDKKYLTIITNEFQIGFKTINSSFYIYLLLKHLGFRFKGKTNLIFKGNGKPFFYNSKIAFRNQNIYLMHFKNNGEEEDIDVLITSIKEQVIKKKRRLRYQEKSSKIFSNIQKSIVKMDKIGKMHPAPFSPEDIAVLIKIFTKKNNLVLDPFIGVGSTLISCIRTGRKGIGIDLNPHYIELAEQRIDNKLFNNTRLILGNSLKEVKKIKNIDYCITSPPYHNILKNKGMGVRHDNSQTRQGIDYYSDQKEDLGNQKSFKDYLSLLKRVMKDVYKNLKRGHFCSIIISDFTVKKIEKNVVGYLIKDLEDLNFYYCGTIILNQEQKSIFPFGYPFDFVINHTNQYIVNFRK